MGKTFENLTWEDLCDLMCGDPEPEPEEDEKIKCEFDNSTLQTENDVV